MLMGGTVREMEDSLSAEAALHLKVNGEAYTTTMRTPGEDEASEYGVVVEWGARTRHLRAK